MITTSVSKQIASERASFESELAFVTNVASRYGMEGADHSALFEAELAAWAGFDRAITTSSETGAVSVMIGALDLLPGDEVIVSPATAPWLLFALMHSGIVPIFVDFSPGLLSIAAAPIKQKISQRSRAILVSLPFGHPTDLTSLRSVGKSAGIPLVFDMTESLGTLLGGRPVYEAADIAILSLREGQSDLSTGEGGVLFFRDISLATKAKSYSRFSDLDGVNFGINQKLSLVQCALGRARLVDLEAKLSARRKALSEIAEEVSRKSIALLHLPPDSWPGSGVIARREPSLQKFGSRVRTIVLAGNYSSLSKHQVEYPIALSTTKEWCSIVPDLKDSVT